MTDPAISYIEHVLETKGWTAAKLAKLTGLAHSTIARPLKQKDYSGRISRRTLQLVRQASGIDPAEFIGHDFPPAPDVLPRHDPAPDGAELIPVYDVAASAGFGAIVDAEDHIANLAFSSQYLREMTNAKGDQLAAIRITGDSMSPTLQTEDTVVIDLTKTNLDYDGLFVVRSGENLLIKRISRGTRRSTVMVVSDNAHYPNVESERTELDVVGKVIWYGRQIR